MPKLNSALLASLALLACAPPPDEETPVNAGLANSEASKGSSSTPGSGSETSTGIFPIVPNHGGGVLASPQVILVTFDGDANQTTLEGDATWVATGGYLPTVAGEYGVGNGTITLVQVSDVPPLPNAVETYLETKLASGALPAHASNNVYVLTIPHSAAGTAAFCANDLGYHSYFSDQNGNQALYAVIPDCGGGLEPIEVTLAHEVVEAATDPLLSTYQIQDPQNPWSMLGGEVADLCASNSTDLQDPTGTYFAPLIWSNAAAARGETPCGPWQGSSVYLTPVTGASPTQTITAGTTATFTLTSWSSAPTGAACNLIVASSQFGDFEVSPALSETSMATAGTVSITLTVPANALPGQHGASWIGCVNSVSGAVMGSIVVAVEAAAGPTGN